MRAARFAAFAGFFAAGFLDAGFFAAGFLGAARFRAGFAFAAAFPAGVFAPFFAGAQDLKAACGERFDASLAKDESTAVEAARKAARGILDARAKPEQAEPARAGG